MLDNRHGGNREDTGEGHALAQMEHLVEEGVEEEEGEGEEMEGEREWVGEELQVAEKEDLT